MSELILYVYNVHNMFAAILLFLIAYLWCHF